MREVKFSTQSVEKRNITVYRNFNYKKFKNSFTGEKKKGGFEKFADPLFRKSEIG